MTERLTAFAKNLRSRSTDAERLLWFHLRAKRMEGLKFRRQQPIGNYIIDFICLEKKLVIELDGGQHTEPDKKKYDRERDACLEEQGYRILRFWDNQVLLNSKEVLTVIREHCVGHPPLYPLPSREGSKKRESLPLDGADRDRESLSSSHSGGFAETKSEDKTRYPSPLEGEGEWLKNASS